MEKKKIKRVCKNCKLFENNSLNPNNFYCTSEPGNYRHCFMKKETFIFFWGHKNPKKPFSNWWIAPFNYQGISFNCVEQFMMYRKAQIFGDEKTAKKILEAESPGTQKKLGRQVANFSPSVWDNYKKVVVYEGSKAKYNQNPKLKELLIKTYPHTLVEASPYDKIWGIGLSADNPKALNRETWQGENLLGEILTELRDELLEENKWADIM
jgi:ribA/ribD-fused uncharacterized protein